jgi:hypothetical protein
VSLLPLLLLLLPQIWSCSLGANQRFRLDFMPTTLRARSAATADTVTNSTALPLLTREEAAAEAGIRGTMSSPPIPSTDDSIEMASQSQAGVEAVAMTSEETAAAAEVKMSPPRPAATAEEMGLGA